METTTKLLTSFYQISGFDFSEAHSTATLSRSGKFCQKSVLHLVYICINLKYQIHIQAELFEHLDVVGSITNEMFLPLFCRFTLVCESFVKQRTEAKIKNLMTEIRSDLNCNLHFKLACLPLRKFSFLFVVNSLIRIAVLIMELKAPGECLVSADSRFRVWLALIKVCQLIYGFCFQLGGSM